MCSPMSIIDIFALIYNAYCLYSLYKCQIVFFYSVAYFEVSSNIMIGSTIIICLDYWPTDNKCLVIKALSNYWSGTLPPKNGKNCAYYRGVLEISKYNIFCKINTFAFSAC